MKPIMMSIAMLFLIGLTSPVASAQGDMPAAKLLSVHEDVVIPSMIEKYELAAKNLAEMLRKHDVSSVIYTAASRRNFSYIYFSPADDFAELDQMGAGFDELKKKMGEKEFDAMMAQFDGCYDSHKNYVVHPRPELSYNPTYGAKIADGLLFRHWDIYFIHPGMEKEANEIAKEWAALNTKVKFDRGYRIYTGGFGTDGPLLAVVASAKNSLDYYTTNEAWKKLVGDAGKSLMARTWKVVRRFESLDGEIRPDISVLPKSVARK